LATPSDARRAAGATAGSGRAFVEHELVLVADGSVSRREFCLNPIVAEVSQSQLQLSSRMKRDMRRKQRAAALNVLTDKRDAPDRAARVQFALAPAVAVDMRYVLKYAPPTARGGPEQVLFTAEPMREQLDDAGNVMAPLEEYFFLRPTGGGYFAICPASFGGVRALAVDMADGEVDVDGVVDGDGSTSWSLVPFDGEATPVGAHFEVAFVGGGGHPRPFTILSRKFADKVIEPQLDDATGVLIKLVADTAASNFSVVVIVDEEQFDRSNFDGSAMREALEANAKANPIRAVNRADLDVTDDALTTDLSASQQSPARGGGGGGGARDGESSSDGESVGGGAMSPRARRPSKRPPGAPKISPGAGRPIPVTPPDAALGISPDASNVAAGVGASLNNLDASPVAGAAKAVSEHSSAEHDLDQSFMLAPAAVATPPKRASNAAAADAAPPAVATAEHASAPEPSVKAPPEHAVPAAADAGVAPAPATTPTLPAANTAAVAGAATATARPASAPKPAAKPPAAPLSDDDVSSGAPVSFAPSAAAAAAKAPLAAALTTQPVAGAAAPAAARPASATAPAAKPPAAPISDDDVSSGAPVSFAPSAAAAAAKAATANAAPAAGGSVTRPPSAAATVAKSAAGSTTSRPPSRPAVPADGSSSSSSSSAGFAPLAKAPPAKSAGERPGTAAPQPQPQPQPAPQPAAKPATAAAQPQPAATTAPQPAAKPAAAATAPAAKPAAAAGPAKGAPAAPVPLSDDESSEAFKPASSKPGAAAARPAAAAAAAPAAATGAPAAAGRPAAKAPPPMALSEDDSSSVGFKVAPKAPAAKPAAPSVTPPAKAPGKATPLMAISDEDSSSASFAPAPKPAAKK
jgi:hypothetical protein